MIRTVARGLWFLAQVAVSGVALPWLWIARRHALLVLTHATDVDASGDDVQMGALLQALERRGDRYFEVRWIPLDRTLLRELGRGRRPFVGHAALLGVARLASFLGMGTREVWRVRLARVVLAVVRPRAVLLIDESGSGQPWLKAARRRGVPSIGIQHGDFQADDPLYGRVGVEARAGEPADRLCVWSPWFQRRLLGISPIYTEANTIVTGRLVHARHGSAKSAALADSRAPRSRDASRVSVLLIGESAPEFAAQVESFVQAVAADRAIEMRVRSHPGARGAFRDLVDAPGSLIDALAGADVVIGVRSSALLEALFFGVPVIVLLSKLQPDPGGLVREGAATGCDSPERLAALCIRLSSEAERAPARSFHERVWGGASEDPAQAVLAILDAELARQARG